MQRSDLPTSACRHCRHYLLQGRRGGHCTQLDVPVQGGWKACSLSAPVFESMWELDNLPAWQKATLDLCTTPMRIDSPPIEASIDADESLVPSNL